jgi:hypothetical protein
MKTILLCILLIAGPVVLATSLSDFNETSDFREALFGIDFFYYFSISLVPFVVAALIACAITYAGWRRKPFAG